MAKVISVINNKGGVGKTTSAAILGELMAILGKRVLEIDLDEQSNLSMFFKCYEDDNDEVCNGYKNPTSKNIAELFKMRYRKKEDVRKLIRLTHIPNLHIIPSSKRHKKTPLNINANETGNNNIILKKALAAIKDEYDFIIIDNAPASNILTVNSMFASDYVITPVRLEGFSYKGLKETLETIIYIKEEHDIEGLEFLGVFITQAEINTNIYKNLSAAYEKELGAKFLRTPIRKDKNIAEIETEFEPILEHSPDTNAVFDYSRLLLELNILDEEATQMLICAISENTEENTEE